MKPLHVAAVGAVVAVAIVVYLLMGGGSRRGGERGRTGREAGGGGPSYTRPVGDEPTGKALPTSLPDASCHAEIAIRTPDGAPAAGAALLIRGTRELSAAAGADGRARIGLVPGLYDLFAHHGNAAGKLRFSIEADKDLGTLTLKTAVEVRGFVYDVRKNPVRGALVDAIARDRHDPASWASYAVQLVQPTVAAASTTSAEDGSYRLLVPGAGHYAFRAHAAGFGVAVEGARPVKDGLDGIDFYLPPGQTLTGIVTDLDDRPIAGALVVTASFARFGVQPPKAETGTGSDGRFAIDVSMGSWIYLSVLAKGYAAYVNPRQRIDTGTVKIRLSPGVAITARTIEKGTGRPVAGVRVGVTHSAGQTVAESGADGRVRLEHLPEKTASLTAYAGGGRWAPVRIDLRQRTPTEGVLDLGDIEVEPGGIVRGRVVDKTTGRPLEGAIVRPFAARSARIGDLLSPGAKTDADGRFELTGVSLQTSVILATRDGYVQELARAELLEHIRGGASIFKAGNKDIRIDVELVPASGITGVVLGPDGRPVGGARIQQRYPAGGWSRVLGIPDPVAFSDAQGRFVLSGFQKDVLVRLMASHRDYGASAEITVTTGREETVTLHLEPPLIVSGLVVNDDGKPIENVRVSLAPEKGGRNRPWGPGTGDPGLTDKKGRYTIRNAPSGNLNVTFSHDQYELVRRPISIGAGRGQEDLGKQVLTRGHGIEGVVVDGRGRPIEGLQLNASWAGEGGPGPRDPSLPPVRQWGNAVTDADGRFRIFGLREGPYRLSINASSLFAEKPVVQTGTRDYRLVARQAAELTGRVMSEGQPVAGAWVRARTHDAGPQRTWTAYLDSGRTDSDGRFTLRKLPPDSTFELTITHTGFKSATIAGVSTRDQNREFQLDAGIKVAGIVVETGGTAVSGAALRLFVDGRGNKWTRSDPEGRFEFGGLSEGALEIEMQGSTQGHVRTGRIPVKGGDLQIRIVVERGFAIGGKLTMKDETKRRGFRIQAVDGDGKVQGMVWTFPGRAYSIKGLAKGRYTLRVQSFSGGKSETVKEIPGVAAGADDVDIQIDG